MDLQHKSFKPCKTMALRESTHKADSDLFRQELSNMINLRHPLVHEPEDRLAISVRAVLALCMPPGLTVWATPSV
jgi:hypothetical protein